MARGGSSTVAAARRRQQQQQDPEQQRQDRVAEQEEPFYVGFAISTYQNSGDPNTNWGAWERGRTALGCRPIRNGDTCGNACNFWELFREDIARAAELGSNCFRFSLEWSRLEPERGRVYQAAVQLYHEMLDCLEVHRLQPFMTLHHFVHPLWFERLVRCLLDRCPTANCAPLHWRHALAMLAVTITGPSSLHQGGFTKEENISIFVEYAEMAFK